MSTKSVENTTKGAEGATKTVPNGTKIEKHDFFGGISGAPNVRAVILEAFLAEQTVVSVGTTVLNLAKQFKDLASFLNTCEHSEKLIKTPKGLEALKSKGVTNLELDSQGYPKLPRCWSQAKSNVKTAWLKGLDPNQFTTEGELRAALNKLRQDNSPDSKDKEEKTTAANIIPEKIDSESAQVLAATATVLVGLDDELREKMLNDIKSIMGKYRKLMAISFTKSVEDTNTTVPEGGTTTKSEDEVAA